MSNGKLKPVAWRLLDGEDYEYNTVDRFSCGRSGGEPLYAIPPDAAAEIARLRAEVERLTKECDNIKLVEFPRRLDKVVEGWRKKCDGQAERIAELEREVEEYDDALLTSDADLMKAQDQAKALATAVMTDQVSNDSHALFIAAIRDLAAISEALGCDPDDGGAVPIIEAIYELKEIIAAQSAALAKAKEALEGVCDSDEECHDSDGWTAAVISFEALHEAQEALETIAQFDGAMSGEEGKEPRHD